MKLCLNKESETCGCQNPPRCPCFHFLCVSWITHLPAPFKMLKRKSEAEHSRWELWKVPGFGKSQLDRHTCSCFPSVPQERRCLLEAGGAGGTGSVRLNLLQEHQGRLSPEGDLGGQCPQGHQVVTIWAEAAQGRVWSMDSATSLPGVKSPYRSKLPDLG